MLPITLNTRTMTRPNHRAGPMGAWRTRTRSSQAQCPVRRSRERAWSIVASETSGSAKPSPPGHTKRERRRAGP
jgi:hypothetical protein